MFLHAAIHYPAKQFQLIKISHPFPSETSETALHQDKSFLYMNSYFF